MGTDILAKAVRLEQTERGESGIYCQEVISHGNQMLTRVCVRVHVCVLSLSPLRGPDLARVTPKPGFKQSTILPSQEGGGLVSIDVFDLKKIKKNQGLDEVS